MASAFMSRVALLIGVSRYPPGLNPVPGVQKDVEVLRRVLRQPQFGFEQPQCLMDASLTEMQEAIEAFFQYRSVDDQTLLGFCGGVFLDPKGKLFFATPATELDERGQLIKAKTIPATFLLEAMNSSAAGHQVLLLDCQFQQLGAATGDRLVDLSSLWADGRVVLTATATTRSAIAQVDLDLWSYTRYLAEGIETGAADLDTDGSLSASDLHLYASRKLQIAAPAMSPRLLGSDRAARQGIFSLPAESPEVRFRKFVQGAIDRGEVDPVQGQLLTGRTLLNDIRTYLGLAPGEGGAIEAEVLRPFNEYQQRLQSYQEQAAGLHQGDGRRSESLLAERLELLRQSCWLTEKDTAAIDAAPYVAEQQRQRAAYQQKLAQYEQVLLAALQRQYPLGEGDRQGLDRLQQVLGLQPADVHQSHVQLTAQIEQQRSAYRSGHPPSFLGVPSTTMPMDSTAPDADSSQLSPDPTSHPTQQPVGADTSTQISPPTQQPVGADTSTQISPAGTTEQAATLPPQSRVVASPTESPFPDTPISNRDEFIYGYRQRHQVPQSREVSVSFHPNPPTGTTDAQAVPDPWTPAPEPTVRNPPVASVPPVTALQPESPAVTPGATPMNQSADGSKRSLANSLKALVMSGLVIAVLGGAVAASYPWWKSMLPVGSPLNPAPVDSSQMNQWIRQGASDLQNGRLQEAVNTYNRILQAKPDETDALVGRALALHRLGDRDGALRDYNKAIDLLNQTRQATTTPQIKQDTAVKLAQAYNNRSHVQYDRGQYDQAEADANAAIALNPRMPEAYVNLANARFRLNKPTEALQAYNQALQLQPSAPLKAGALTNRGNVRMPQDPKTAIQDYTQAIQAKNDYADAYYNRGLAQESSGNVQQAIVDFRRAAKLYQIQGNPAMFQESIHHSTRLEQGSPISPPPTARSDS